MTFWFPEAGRPTGEPTGAEPDTSGAASTPLWRQQPGVGPTVPPTPPVDLWAMAGDLETTGFNPIVKQPIAEPPRPRRAMPEGDGAGAEPAAVAPVPDTASPVLPPPAVMPQSAPPAAMPQGAPPTVMPQGAPPAAVFTRPAKAAPVAPADAAAVVPQADAAAVVPQADAAAVVPQADTAALPEQDAAAVPAPDATAAAEQATGGKKSKHRLARTITIIAVCVAVVVGATVGIAYAALNGRLNRVNTSSMLGGDRPTNDAASSDVRSIGDPFAGRAMNILVIGSDSRAGNNNKYAGDANPGQRSDTTFILHVSADRSRVEVLSIPRDTLITIPNCVYADGTKVSGSGAGRQKFNAAFAYGSMGKKGTLASGVACSIKAVEAMSDVRIDGSVVVDFAGFASIVDAIGGVDLYLPCAVKAPKADKLVLKQGVNHLDGKTATSYARARTGIGLGDGSDLMRIQRQQALFDALAKKVLSMNYFTSAATLYGFVGSVADSVTTDLGSLADIAGFGFSLRDFNIDKLSFAMVPVGSAGDGANVVLLPSADKPYWDALAKDTGLPTASSSSSTSSSSKSPSKSPTATPSASSTAGPPPGVVSAPSNQCH